MKITLSHDWAYPTSHDAKGYPKGCYSISATILDGTDAHTETIATGFRDLGQVHAFMEELFRQTVAKAKNTRKR